MSGDATGRELIARNGDVVLAGTLWLPRSQAVATVLMYPGSGPADRDNDVLFPPIRLHLLAHGIAVCSFDKRGVGGSTGRWQDAGIVAQALDVVAAVKALRVETRFEAPVGLFGHSQGGWVVLEASRHGLPLAFVVTNSGPGVTPGEQERYAAQRRMLNVGLRGSEIDAALRHFDTVLTLLREKVPYEDARARLNRRDLAVPARIRAMLDVPSDPAEWAFMAETIDYDPRAALTEVRVPLLALFGADDAVVPVKPSVRTYQHAVRTDLLTVRVFPHSDHRIHDAHSKRLATGYLQAISSFIATVAH